MGFVLSFYLSVLTIFHSLSLVYCIGWDGWVGFIISSFPFLLPQNKNLFFRFIFSSLFSKIQSSLIQFDSSAIFL